MCGSNKKGVANKTTYHNTPPTPSRSKNFDELDEIFCFTINDSKDPFLCIDHNYLNFDFNQDLCPLVTVAQMMHSTPVHQVEPCKWQ